MFNIFGFFSSLVIMMVKVAGYALVFFMQLIWYLVLRRFDSMGDAFGFFGREVTEAFSDFMQSVFSSR